MALFRTTLIATLVGLGASVSIRHGASPSLVVVHRNESADTWHKELGKGLAHEHNVDTKGGQTNATTPYETVEERAATDTLNPHAQYAPLPVAARKSNKNINAAAEDSKDDARTSAEEDDVQKRVDQEKAETSSHVEAGGEESSEKKDEKKKATTTPWYDDAHDAIKDVTRSGAHANCLGAIVTVLFAVTVLA